MIYLITYDRNYLLKNYEDLKSEIKKCSNGHWWHHLNNTWLVDSELSAVEINLKLKPHLGKKDRILIIRIFPMRETIDYDGWINKKGWDWLRQRLK